LSNAFRARASNDLYFPYFGNPELDLSGLSAESWACSSFGTWATLRASGVPHRTHGTSLFTTRRARAHRISTRRRVTGLELDGTWRSGTWLLGAKWPVLRAVNDQTGERLLRRAPWIVNVSQPSIQAYGVRGLKSRS